MTKGHGPGTAEPDAGARHGGGNAHIPDISKDVSKPGGRGSHKARPENSRSTQPALLCVHPMHHHAPCHLKSPLQLRRLSYPLPPLLSCSNSPRNLKAKGLEKVIRGHNIPTLPPIEERDSLENMDLLPSSGPLFMSSKAHCQKTSCSRHKF